MKEVARPEQPNGDEFEAITGAEVAGASGGALVGSALGEVAYQLSGHEEQPAHEQPAFTVEQAVVGIGFFGGVFAGAALVSFLRRRIFRHHTS